MADERRPKGRDAGTDRRPGWETSLAAPRRPPGRLLGLERGGRLAELTMYAVAGLLVVARGFTIVDLVEGSGSREITDGGVVLLDRILR